VNIIENISFKGNFEKKFTSIELSIVQDADRLDAIGAIGIARTFNYGGFKKENSTILKSPKFKVLRKNTRTILQRSIISTSIALKDKMNTATGKQIAQERHRYMEGFLAQFYGMGREK
jgi:uncharacterized protein